MIIKQLHLLLFLYLNLLEDFNLDNYTFYNLVNSFIQYVSYILLSIHCTSSILEIILIKVVFFEKYIGLNLDLALFYDFMYIDYFESFEPLIYFIENKYFYNDFYIFKSESFFNFNNNFFNYSFFNFNVAFIYSFKLTLSLLFLIFIRAGLPRYRYDYLTKLGWSKFLFLILFFFIFFFIIYSFL